MKVLGLICVKDGGAWLHRCLDTHFTICDHVLMLDDGSTDETPAIAATYRDRLTYLRQDGLIRNEARDRNKLFELAHAHNPDWCWWFDADETLYRGRQGSLDIIGPATMALRTDLFSMWRDETHHRRDWLNTKTHLFRYRAELCRHYHWRGTGPHAIHAGGCPKIPEYTRATMAFWQISELHWGWLNPTMTEQKLTSYRAWDPNYATYQGYRKHEHSDQREPFVEELAQSAWHLLEQRG